MGFTLTDLAIRASLITETLSHHADWARALEEHGADSKRLDEGRDGLVKALTKMDALAEHADDHTAPEQARRAVTELDGWYATTRRIWGRILRSGDTGISDARWSEMLGEELEGHDELFIVLMRAWRLISTTRVAGEAVDTLRKANRRVEDDVQRGYVLMLKAAESLHKVHHIARGERRHGTSASEIDMLRKKLDAWLTDVASAAALTFATEPWPLGMLGVVPEGLGLPLGGTAYDVILHERARGEIPDPIPAPPCPGWGTGAGGNRENYWEHQQ